jgi:hypothetical protein
LHTLGILSTSFMRNAFSTSLKEFPHMLSTCWLLFLHSVIQLIPNHLKWVEVGWLWRPGHLTQHSITLFLCQTHSNAHPVSREITVATLDLSVVGAPILCLREHWSRKPQHLDGVPSYLSRTNKQASLTWAGCWMGCCADTTISRPSVFFAMLHTAKNLFHSRPQLY